MKVNEWVQKRELLDLQRRKGCSVMPVFTTSHIILMNSVSDPTHNRSGFFGYTA